MPIKKAFQRLTGLLPSQLPMGMQDLDRFCISIFNTYDLPDMPSYRHAIATMIMHLGPTQSRAAKKYFAISIKKAMSNQVAYELILKIKEDEKQTKEVTTAPATESHVEQPVQQP